MKEKMNRLYGRTAARFDAALESAVLAALSAWCLAALTLKLYLAGPSGGFTDLTLFAESSFPLFVLLLVLFLLAAVLRNNALKTTLFGLGIIGSVAVFLIPETILPMCMMRTMRCYTVMQPFVRIMAVLIAASGVINGLHALRQNNQEG